MTNLQKDNGSYSNSREELDFNIGDYLLKLKRRWIPALAVFVFTVGTTAFLSSLLEKTYKSEGKILFKKDSLASIEDLGNPSDFRAIRDDDTPLATEKVRMTSEPVVQETIDQLKLEDAEGKPLTPKAFTKRLDVQILGGTDIIAMSYKDPDPVTAKNVVDTLMDVYMKAQISSSTNAIEKADSFIATALPQEESKLQSLESRLQDFYEKNQIVDLQEEKKILVNELGNLNRQISTVGAELQGKKAQTISLQNQLGLNLNQAISATQLGNTPQVQSILKNVKDLMIIILWWRVLRRKNRV